MPSSSQVALTTYLTITIFLKESLTYIKEAFSWAVFSGEVRAKADCI